ncbi:MAG: hypothetical protein OEZ39_02580 [Gammaproteobacteria bacterium]|nr:hypothetical protein [Gammaproteobacteria bacterium]MDH5650741.1 hypothetical protein [Gammaproteobacteria bacterium]
MTLRPTILLMTLAGLLAACSSATLHRDEAPSSTPAEEAVMHEGGIGGTGNSDDCATDKRRGKPCKEAPRP